MNKTGETAEIVSALHKEIEAGNRHMQFLMDASPNFIVTARKNSIEYINRSFLDFLGFAAKEDMLKNNKGVEDFICRIDETPFPDKDLRNWLDYITDNCDARHTVYLNTPQHKSPKAFVITCSSFRPLDRHLIVFSDADRIEKEKEFLRYQSTIDRLTDIFNRLKFDSQLITEINRSKRYGNSLSLIIFDVDRFSTIDKAYGASAGDTVLREVASVVSKKIREHDFFARWGGEEFVLLTPDTELSNAEKLAEKLRGVIAGHKFHIQDVSVTCSFGATQYTHDDNIEGFIKRASEALSRARKNGRNRVETVEA